MNKPSLAARIGLGGPNHRLDAIDAVQLLPGLWMGSKPDTGHKVSEAGFGLLVLCADEYQPPGSLFPGVRVIHAPFVDEDISEGQDQQSIAFEAANMVADAVRGGIPTLVTCYAGRNRSGLVAALAMVALQYEPVRAIVMIRARRQSALTNPSFVDLILRSAQ